MGNQKNKKNQNLRKTSSSTRRHRPPPPPLSPSPPKVGPKPRPKVKKNAVASSAFTPHLPAPIPAPPPSPRLEEGELETATILARLRTYRPPAAHGLRSSAASNASGHSTTSTSPQVQDPPVIEVSSDDDGSRAEVEDPEGEDDNVEDEEEETEEGSVDVPLSQVVKAMADGEEDSSSDDEEEFNRLAEEIRKRSHEYVAREREAKEKAEAEDQVLWEQEFAKFASLAKQSAKAEKRRSAKLNLQLVYTLPWYKKGVLPDALENAGDWATLTSRVAKHIEYEKSCGRGVVKDFSIKVWSEDAVQTGAALLELPGKKRGDRIRVRALPYDNGAAVKIEAMHYCAKCSGACVIGPDGRHHAIPVDLMAKWVNAVDKPNTGVTKDKVPNFVCKALNIHTVSAVDTSPPKSGPLMSTPNTVHAQAPPVPATIPSAPAAISPSMPAFFPTPMPMQTPVGYGYAPNSGH
ncbi:hypothetical protein BD310DRAFT_977803 [Dichomitus squalens]|uniref:Uncharacterized protein n=1 Tax=Dichomitus squalens TaxID=114155 RepID=A0A4V2K7Z1_9APHY|nr:hypothetical protein BD310DRAFT_977803 [Dichomitus squalens]